MKDNIHCPNPNCFDDHCRGECETKAKRSNEDYWESLAKDFLARKEKNDNED